VALSSFYGYSSFQEQQRRKALIELTNRFKASLAARATYLEITSHYIKTPITKMQGVVELLKSGVVVTSSTSTTTSSQAALAATSTTLTIPENTIMAASSGLASLTEHADQLLAEGQSLTGAQQAHISDFSKRQILSILSHPGFWLPASVITSLTLLANVVFIQADKYDATTINLASQILLGIIGILALLVSLYFLQQAKAQKRLAQDQADIEADIRSRQQQLIDNAANDLTTDLELLAGLQSDIARYPKTTAYKQGITDLTTVIDQFSKLRDLTRSVPGVSWQTDTSAVLNQAIADLRSRADDQGVTIATTGTTKLPTANIEEAALLHLITAPLKNAVQASPQGSQVELAATATIDHTIQLTITDHGPGIPADKLNSVFEPFNSATGTERFNNTGLGLDLYLARTICEQYGAEIRLGGGVENGGTVVTVVLPQTAHSQGSAK
jgi:signal transduction histidine kinase